MNRHFFRRSGSVLLLLALLLGVLPAAAAGQGNLYITGYTVKNTADVPVGSVTKGMTVNIAVSIKDTGDGTGAVDPGTLDITKLDDSFTGGSLSVQRTSQPGAPLVYEVQLTGLTYKGVGQVLRLQVGTAGQADSYQTMEVTITEAVVYEAPQPTPAPVPTPPEPAPAPMVVISYSELKKPLEAGKEAEITVYFRNLSSTRLKSPVATFTPSDALTIQGGATSFVLDDIPGNKTASVKFKVKAAAAIPTPTQSLGVELKFNYFNNLTTVQGTAADKIAVPTQVRESVPQPPVVVTRSAVEEPIAPGQTVDLTLTFRNGGGAKLVSPVLSITPSDALVLLSDSATFLLPDIEPGRSQSVKIQIRAAKELAASSQSLSTELKFSYDNGTSVVQATATDRLVLPTQGKETVPQPLVILTRDPMDHPLSAGEEVDITLRFQNAGGTKVVSPVAAVTPSDSLMLLNDTSSFLLPDIEPGETQSVTVRLKAVGELTAGSQSLSTDLKYSYFNGETMTQATLSDKVSFATNPTVKMDPSVPNVVIRDFGYGESSVAAGSRFPLTFAFENTGSVPIENVVVTVDGGESFAMNGSTNTYFFRSLSAGGKQSQKVPMRSVPGAKSGAQAVSVSFKYEYVDGTKRTQATTDIKLSVPVYQPDRFQINTPILPESINVGEEFEITMAYMNKGKDDIANLEATIEGDGVDTPARTQYLGNVTAGTNGNIGFAITPNQEGQTKIVLKISYENADQQVQVREFPLTLEAVEFIPPPDFPDEDLSTEENQFPWMWAAIGGGAGALLLLLFLVHRKKAKKAAQAESWDDWGEESSAPGGEE